MVDARGEASGLNRNACCKLADGGPQDVATKGDPTAHLPFTHFAYLAFTQVWCVGGCWWRWPAPRLWPQSLCFEHGPYAAVGRALKTNLPSHPPLPQPGKLIQQLAKMGAYDGLANRFITYACLVDLDARGEGAARAGLAAVSPLGHSRASVLASPPHARLLVVVSQSQSCPLFMLGAGAPVDLQGLLDEMREQAEEQERPALDEAAAYICANYDFSGELLVCGQ